MGIKINTENVRSVGRAIEGSNTEMQQHVADITSTVNALRWQGSGGETAKSVYANIAVRYKNLAEKHRFIAEFLGNVSSVNYENNEKAVKKLADQF